MPEPVKPDSPCLDVPPELAHHPKYRILRELGRGGMGIVYLARQIGMMDRQVVIKVINRSLIDNPEVLARFRREVQAAAQLSHPNTVTAYNAEQVGDLHLLVMELVPGQNLADVLDAKGSLPVTSACHYIRHAARALQHAHERGMVHRDIKPENLMLTPEGQIKVLDFGIAKVVSEQGTRTGLTASNSYMGTPEYSAPEQATDARSADIRADLYSLGCTLYCLLAGRPPFQEDTVMKTLLAHLQKEPPPLLQLRPDVPEGLWRVVARLLAKEPGQRYQKPIEVVQALTPFVKSGTKPDAKRGSLPIIASPEKGTVITAEIRPLKNLLREVPEQTQPTNVPTKNESSRREDLRIPSALARKKKRAKDSTSRAPSPRHWRWLVLAAASVLLVLLGMWASGVFKVKTMNGTIVPENLPAVADSERAANDKGFVPLFNGKSLTGWKTHPWQPGNWCVEKGILIGSGRTDSYLYTDRGDYKDFHLLVEARINAGGNSGVCFRTPFGPRLPAKAPKFLIGYEANLNSTDGTDVHKTGSLWVGGVGSMVSIREAPVPPETWFTMAVIAEGNRIIVKVNGKTTADFTDEKRLFSSGHIALQKHNPLTVAAFRKIEIQEPK